MCSVIFGSNGYSGVMVCTDRDANPATIFPHKSHREIGRIAIRDIRQTLQRARPPQPRRPAPITNVESVGEVDAVA